MKLPICARLRINQVLQFTETIPLVPKRSDFKRSSCVNERALLSASIDGSN